MEHDTTQVTVNVTKSTMYALFWAMSRWPKEDTDVLVNRLMRWGWQIIDLLHQGATLRSSVPLRGPLGWMGRCKLESLEITDDPYACPDRYIQDLTQSDALDQAVLSLSAGKAVRAESRPVQALTVRFVLETSNVNAYETYAAFYSKTDAINRLIQCGYLRGLVESQKGRFEYRVGETKSWSPLPSG